MIKENNESFKDVFADKLVVDAAVAAALGTTAGELADMTLGEFYLLAIDKGYEVEISAFESTAEAQTGNLSITMAAAESVAGASA
jgi:hypothetical protein